MRLTAAPHRRGKSDQTAVIDSRFVGGSKVGAMTTIRLHDISKAYVPGGRSAARVESLPRQPRANSRAMTAHQVLPAVNSFQEASAQPQALRHVNLEIRSGETMGILGPSGCGKTTLLKVVAGLISPDAGTITFDGEEVNEKLPGERRIGIVFQDYALYPHMLSE